MQLVLKKYQPPTNLLPYIRYYYTIHTENAGTASMLLKNHPQGNFDIIFTLHGDTNLHNDVSGERKLADVFLIGQQATGFSFQFDQQTDFIGIAFQPEAMKQVFNIPVNELLNTGIHADEVIGRELEVVLNQLRSKNSIGERISILNEMVIGNIVKLDSSFDGFDKLIGFIRENKGMLSVSNLAHHANLGLRTLQRRFLNRVGIGPKAYSNVVRFNSALVMLKQTNYESWTDVLYDLGYFDQMHFIKEFKQFTGRTPTNFVNSDIQLSEFFLHQ